MLLFTLFGVITLILQKFQIVDYSNYLRTYYGNIKYALVTALILIVVFFFTCIFIDESKSLKEHFEYWNYNVLKILRISRVVFQNLILFFILCVNNHSMPYSFKLFMYPVIALILIDIFCVISISSEYSTGKKRTILDSILLQTSDLIFAMLVWTALSFVYHYTIIGALLIIVLFYNIYNFFDK